MDRRIRGGVRSPLMVAGLLLVILGCSAQTPVTPTPRGAIPDWRVELDEPYPFGASPPPLTPTLIDGSYSRDPTDLTGLTRIGCVRCQPYPLDRGASLLTLDAGRWRMQHEAPPYRARGHYLVSADVLTLLNDAECGSETGTYRWRIVDEELTLEALEDACAFGQRERDLTDRTWRVD
ncbi:MAG: hypothetical protein H0X59_06535 [Chloroflexi bacterium]|nr:hypothetical protein [Chloroflexota bacterium]